MEREASREKTQRAAREGDWTRERLDRYCGYIGEGKRERRLDGAGD